jgi:hypothetical protein
MSRDRKQQLKDLQQAAKCAIENVEHCKMDHLDSIRTSDAAMAVLTNEDHEDHECIKRLAGSGMTLAIHLQEALQSKLSMSELFSGETQQPAPQAQPAPEVKPQPETGKAKTIAVPPGAAVVDTKENPIMGWQLNHAVAVMQQFTKDHGTMYHPSELLKRMHSSDPKVKADTEKLCANAVSLLAMFCTVMRGGSVDESNAVPVFQKEMEQAAGDDPSGQSFQE